MPAGVDAHPAPRHRSAPESAACRPWRPGRRGHRQQIWIDVQPAGIFNAATGKTPRRRLGSPPTAPCPPRPTSTSRPPRPAYSRSTTPCAAPHPIACWPARMTPASWPIFNPQLHGHGAIVGSTGTGKTTSAAFTVATAALAAGYGLVILDPEGGADWAAFGARADLHEADRETFPRPGRRHRRGIHAPRRAARRPAAAHRHRGVW